MFQHCGKKFITRRLLLMHCRAKHGYEKTDKCSFCEYRASNAEQVKVRSSSSAYPIRSAVVTVVFDKPWYVFEVP
jgi:hypothetical protein